MSKHEISRHNVEYLKQTHKQPPQKNKTKQKHKKQKQKQKQIQWNNFGLLTTDGW